MWNKRCSNRFTANRVVRPNRKAPLSTADEVSMVVADPQIMDRGNFVQVGDGFDGDPLAVVRGQLISELHLLGTNPASVLYIKRMFAGCSYFLAANTQSH